MCLTRSSIMASFPIALVLKTAQYVLAVLALGVLLHLLSRQQALLQYDV